MLISTKGRYALRIMIDLAEHDEGGYIPMKEVAQRQQISLKYIEKIMPVLTKSEFVEGLHGKGGGYRLVKEPKEYRVGDILKATEGSLAPVSCLVCEEQECDRAEDCRTLFMWVKCKEMLEEYFNSITLSELMKSQSGVL